MTVTLADALIFILCMVALVVPLVPIMRPEKVRFQDIDKHRYQAKGKYRE